MEEISFKLDDIISIKISRDVVRDLEAEAKYNYLAITCYKPGNEVTIRIYLKNNLYHKFSMDIEVLPIFLQTLQSKLNPSV